jgi:hypothetical protein
MRGGLPRDGALIEARQANDAPALTRDDDL